MNLDLLEKVFTDIDTSFYPEEAREIGTLFFWTAMEQLSYEDIDKNFGDYWIQIGKDWDLNIYFDGEQYKGSLYEVFDGIVDDTQNPLPLVNLNFV